MNSDEIHAFVDRLERNQVLYEEFQELEAGDWEALKGLLLERKQVRLQNHVRAVHLIKTRTNPKWVRPKPRRSYSEQEILDEFGSRGDS